GEPPRLLHTTARSRSHAPVITALRLALPCTAMLHVDDLVVFAGPQLLHLSCSRGHQGPFAHSEVRPEHFQRRSEPARPLLQVPDDRGLQGTTGSCGSA